MEAANYNEIGQLLRLAREERRLKLAEIAQTLHIRMRYLDALESGRLSELPGLSYAKGYLQVYATYVGLDKDEILRRFEEVENQLGGRRGFYFPQVLRTEKTPGRAMVWGGLAGALILYIFWLAVLQPVRYDVSAVEQFPIKVEIRPISPLSADDGACLGSKPALYPPCTMVQESASLVQLRSQLYSLEGMANRKSRL